MWSKVIPILCAAAATTAVSAPNFQTLPVIRAAEKEQPRKSTLAGTWVNELGSKMILKPPNAQGEFSGTYLTAVSASEKPIRISPLFGVQNAPTGEDEPTFGFTVSWTFSASTTVFVGQRFVNKAGEEVLQTTWLLRAKVDSAGDNWLATRVGTNVFKRTK